MEKLEFYCLAVWIFGLTFMVGGAVFGSMVLGLMGFVSFAGWLQSDAGMLTTLGSGASVGIYLVSTFNPEDLK